MVLVKLFAALRAPFLVLTTRSYESAQSEIYALKYLISFTSFCSGFYCYGIIVNLWWFWVKRFEKNFTINMHVFRNFQENFTSIIVFFDLMATIVYQYRQIVINFRKQLAAIFCVCNILDIFSYIVYNR